MTLINLTTKSTIAWNWILGLSGFKLLFHLAVNIFTSYGLHRDEFLYLDEANHLAWGYMEVPPVIAFIGRISTTLFGSEVWAVRFFPALIGAISIILIGVMTSELGGKKWAQITAMIGFLFSPVFIGSNNLFQPVSFNQFCWLLTAFISIRILHRGWKNYWWILGVVVGIGFLTKYSYMLFLVSLIIGVILSSSRKVLWDRRLLYAMVLAVIIMAPNLWWQYTHHFPVINHMEDLSRTQLVHVNILDFTISQFLKHFTSTLIWLPGLIFGLWDKELKPYRFLSFTYLLVFILVLALSGKDYYIYGAYGMIFVLGGIAWEKWLSPGLNALLLVVVCIFNLLVVPFAIPVLAPQKMINFASFFKENLGIDAPLRWEDGSIRALPQDFADMLGWEEIPQKVAALYHGLSEEERNNCMIYGGSYGHAGVINYYRKEYDLPQAYSFSSSYMLWLPDTLDIDCQIQVEDNLQGVSRYFYDRVLIDSISSPYARDPGYIYYNKNPRGNIEKQWIDLVGQMKKEIYR